MNTGLEEALAESLASLEKGGSIEECLARYPELASELEPLLRTALGLQQAYDVGLRPAFQQAARQRFLATASRRGRRPLVVAPPPRRFGFGWRWAPAALGTAALVAFVAWATVLALASGGGGGNPNGRIAFGLISPTPAQVVVSRLPTLVKQTEDRLTEIRAQVEGGGTLQPQAIQDLRDATQSLVQNLQDPAAALPQEDAPRIKDLLEDQQQVLSQAKQQDQVPPEAADDLDDAIAIAQAGAIRIEELLSPTATATPTASPTPTPTPAPTGSPAASPTPTATQAASATGTPTPASSITPGPAGAETVLPLTPTPSP